jgi:transcription elongation GreA/GreB family factor
MRAADDLVGAFDSLGAAPLWQAACACLVKALPERARELLAELLLIAPMGACDDVAGHLVEAGFSAEEFAPLVQQVLSDPARHTQALLWLWDGPDRAEVGGYRLAAVITRMLAVLRGLPRDDEVSRERKREIVANTRSVLATRKYERFRACLEEIEAGMASALLTQIRRLTNLGRAVHEDLQRLVRSRFPDLDAAPAVEPWADESVLLTTSSGLAQQQARIDELINVKMHENARRIGEAASHGDLSDNAEYKFALEERDLLRARLAYLQEQLGLAKVIQARDVETDRIGVGTRVTLRHLDSGSPVEMVFLGPWDADIERHVYNYKAPVAQALMGKTVGQTVELTTTDPQGSYEIVAIGNELA